jgi:hypothetical protein
MNYILPTDIPNLFINMNLSNFINVDKILIMNEYTIILNNYNVIFNKYDFLYGNTNLSYSCFPFILTNKLRLNDINLMYQNMNTNMNNNMIPSDIIDKFNLNYNKDYKENFGSNCIFLRENYENILNNLLFKHFVI